MKNLGVVAAIAIVATLVGAIGVCGAETFVLPVVARGVHGLNGSVWDSEARIASGTLGPAGAVKRLWVALPGGGFVDDPATAPSWAFPPIFGSVGFSPMGMVVLTGDQLLQGTEARKGAVALEVDGTSNEVFLHNVNTLGQPRLQDPTGGVPCCLAGNGQLLRALRDPLAGEGFVPWITSGQATFRASVGVINPTAQARTITINLRVLGPIAGTYPTGRADGTYWLLDGNSSDPVGPAMVFFSDNASGLPFYAYASLIYSPLNHPEFIAAVPMPH